MMKNVYVGYPIPTLGYTRKVLDALEEPKDDPVVLNVSNLTLGVNGTALITITSNYSSIPVYESSNKDVVTVDSNGKVTVIGPGSAVITVTVGLYSATCNVTVEDREITNYMYYGVITEVISSFQDIKDISGLTMVEAGVLDKTYIKALSGEKVVVLIPDTTPYIATKDDGVGTKVAFDDTYQGCNGELITIDNITYRCYGELAIIDVELFIYVD